MQMERSRPNPDDLLAGIQAEEQGQRPGRLKIFLGYAAGVGKTFSMLEAARLRRAEGVDVVVAYAETHGRPETEAFLESMEVLPRRKVEYRNVSLSELDVDALLARRPALALIDELAHTNAPGSRHPKRYQDVEEVLRAGIDVYTTLNVQHLESLNDVVARITGVVVRETVPDRLLDEATEIEVVDLPPEELLKRLADGKVYVSEQAAMAVQQFFRKGNLTALRELVLRRAAERVDDQMRAYMKSRAIPGPWPASDRLLVYVGEGSVGENLVRAARRLADQLNAEWTAISIETPAQAKLPPAQQEQIARTLKLAEDLGARVVTQRGPSPTASVADYARANNITKIIAGQPLRPHWWDLLQRSAVDRFLRQSQTLDVYVVSGEAAVRQTGKEIEQEKVRLPGSWRPMAKAIGLVALATLIGEAASFFFSPTNVAMIYLIAVTIAAISLGRVAAVVVSFLGVLAFDFFIVPPKYTLGLHSTEYFLTFVALAAVGLVIGHLTSRVSEQVEASKQREAETSALYSLAQDLAVAPGLTELLDVIVRRATATFGGQAAVFLPGTGKDKGPHPRIQTPSLVIDANERATAVWAFHQGKPAGKGTDTLPGAKGYYLPLKTPHGVVGVLGIYSTLLERHLGAGQRGFLEAFANIAGLSIERGKLAEEAQNAEILKATDRLQTALLNSISHDLRTPLVSITGALSSLQEEKIVEDSATRESLVNAALLDAEQLNRLVGNLLDMTRIEAGAMRIVKLNSNVLEVVETAVEQMGQRTADHVLRIDVPDSLPLAPMDPVLMTQVFVNILDNAVKYSPAGSPIEIRAVPTAEGYLRVEVADRGVGIPEQDLVRVFDKFYRVQRPERVGGTGLGLSICKGIVEAHGGHIHAEDRPGGGTSLIIELPLKAPAVETKGNA